MHGYVSSAPPTLSSHQNATLEFKTVLCFELVFISDIHDLDIQTNFY